jgi:hypothetical protein
MQGACSPSLSKSGIVSSSITRTRSIALKYSTASFPLPHRALQRPLANSSSPCPFPLLQPSPSIARSRVSLASASEETIASSSSSSSSSSSQSTEDGQPASIPAFGMLFVTATLPLLHALAAVLGLLGRGVDAIRHAVASLFPQLEGVSRQVCGTRG